VHIIVYDSCRGWFSQRDKHKHKYKHNVNSHGSENAHNTSISTITSNSKIFALLVLVSSENALLFGAENKVIILSAHTYVLMLVLCASSLPLCLRWLNTVFDTCVHSPFSLKPLIPRSPKLAASKLTTQTLVLWWLGWRMCLCHGNMNKYKQAFKIGFVNL